MLDADLAAIYGVTTKQLNQQLKRNRNRFPEDFAFRLTAKEVKNGERRYLPWVFAEHGAIMPGRARSPSAPQWTAQRSVPTMKREIGFHVREISGRYRTKKRF